MLAAAIFTTFSTTLSTTVLIAYRIYSISKHDGSFRGFKPIIDIMVQSGATNSLTLLAFALCAIPGTGNLLTNTRLFAAQNYIENLTSILVSLPFISLSEYWLKQQSSKGMSTTIMVARVALPADDTTFPSVTSTHLSGLQFQANSTAGTTTQMVEINQSTGSSVPSANEASNEIAVEEIKYKLVNIA
ncbi:hypothetical protein BDN70DRAFT_932535 [Pholiota conissans]|uniref:Uncharacterized protein n=1 Tax=Pholiota conissans TaxID=109636 RepID=A0A9P6D0K6_9AGAR|nr:hypothetical protein BDN70DRAFT_932535 [Pholiota conissans]